MASMLRKALVRDRNVRVSICVPCRDSVHAGFAFDLTKLIQYCATSNLEVYPHFHIGTLIVNQREQLIDMATEAQSTHVLWLDSDMMFPPDTLHRLLRHDVPIVAGNYATRQYPHKTVAYRDLGDWRSYLMHDPDDADQPELTAVAAVGMGCMLVSMDVIGQMDKPRFQTTWVPESNDHMGEDFYFCTQARALGYEILIDTRLSSDLQHLGTMAFKHSMVRRGLA